MHKINQAYIVLAYGKPLITELFEWSSYADLFWKELELWLLQKFNIELAFESKDICLCKKMNDNYVMMNLIIVLAKKHIYRQRLEKRNQELISS